ncbi:MAG TPA: hypothetical protein VK858_09130 [Longimicrobiales bacterium]|nr:hypothetical protein [Longimicrobiales bacterium]
MSGGTDRERDRYTWIRRPPEASERRRAGALSLTAALAVGGVVFYVARALLARDRIALRPEDEGPGE